MTTLRLIATLGLAFVSISGQAADAQLEGKALFAKHCAACHGERGFATVKLEKKVGKERAMLEHRNDISVVLVQHVVRNGIGSMPWFTRVELSDSDATAIGSYLASNKP